MSRTLIGAVMALAVAPAAQQPADLVASRGDAVVHVYIRVEKERDRFGKDWFKDETDKRSGVLVDPSGLVVTHWGVAVDAFEADGSAKAGHSLQVELAGGEVRPAEVVAKDVEVDLALLRIEPPEGGVLPFLELADSERFAPGEPVVAIGRPDGGPLIAFAGAAARSSGGAELGTRVLDRAALVLTDASIRPSNHGGALVDSRGRLLGLCNARWFREPKSEPKPEDLEKPHFGVAVGAHVIRQAFAKEFETAGITNSTLRSAPEPTGADPWAEAVARVAPSVVCVHTSAKPPELDAYDPYARRRARGVGSGVVIDSSGLVLANLHVVAPDPRSVRVTTLDGQSYGAEVLARDEGLNVALLRVSAPGARLTFAELGSSGGALKGERVFAVGNPRGYTLSVGTGVISATNRSARVGGDWIPTSGLLQVDAPVDPGNTGGAVVDLTGRVIGILNAGERDELVIPGEQQKDTNIGFAIPIDRLRKVFRDELDSNAGANATVASAPAASEAELTQRRSKVTDLAERLAPSLVNVYVSVEVGGESDVFDPFAEDERKLMTRGLGSGVIIDENGLALTNWHVIDGADGVRVRTGAGKEYAAEVLSSSRIDDLALLQLVLEPGQKVDPVPLGDSGALPIGAQVVAIGNPYGHANTVTAGVLSAKDQAIHIKGRARKFEGLLQVDAAINPGNSGGALLDPEGNLIGINSAGSNADAEVGYAIPVDYVREKFHTKLLSVEKLGSAYLGLQVVDQDGAPVVRSIDRNGPAARAGFEIGDVVRRVGAAAVQSRVDFVRLTLAAVPGEPLEIELERGGDRLTLAPAPLSGVVWRAYRQSGIEVEDIDQRAEAELIRDSQIAMYRHYTGDPTAEPPTLRGTGVRVVRVNPSHVEAGLAIEPGDVLLGVEISGRLFGGGETTKLVPFEDTRSLGAAFDRYATKEEIPWPCYVYRDGAVRVVGVRIKRVP